MKYKLKWSVWAGITFVVSFMIGHYIWPWPYWTTDEYLPLASRLANYEINEQETAPAGEEIFINTANNLLDFDEVHEEFSFGIRPE